tara:strand:- start:3440 stop:4897 length:1458 start_codon:yes stop_codon:yes gene_type:complete
MYRILEQKTSTLLLGLLSVLLFFCFLFFFSFYHSLIPNYQNFNIAILSSIIIYNILYGMIVLYDKNIAYILFSPLFWYKFISTLFYGIGPLAYYFGSSITIEVMNLYFFITDQTLSKIVLIYIAVICLTDFIFLILNHSFPIPKKISPKTINKKLLLFYALGVGLFSKYLVIFPSTYLGINAPGIFHVLTTFIYVGIFLLYSIGQQNNSYKMFFYLLVFFEMVSSFLVLSKEYLYMSIIFASFVVFFHNKNIKSILITGAIAGILYVSVIQNLFILLRNAEEGSYGITSTTELESAFDTAKTLRNSGQDAVNFQAWWDRLSYVKYQGYAVEAYDMEYEGNTFQQFKYIFIPRILYPEKPNLNPGGAYNSLVQNSFSEKNINSTGPGLFVEAYWNGGWTYLTFTIIYFSFLLFFFSKIVIKNLKEKNYLILMLAVNAIYIGRSIDDWFVGRYGGFILNMIILYLFSVFIYKGLESILNTSNMELNE